MGTRTYSKTFQGLKREDIWRIWTDINNWPTWHGDLDYCKLDGDFKIGNYFFLKPKGMKPVQILLTEKSTKAIPSLIARPSLVPKCMILTPWKRLKKA